MTIMIYIIVFLGLFQFGWSSVLVTDNNRILQLSPIKPFCRTYTDRSYVRNSILNTDSTQIRQVPKESLKVWKFKILIIKPCTYLIWSNLIFLIFSFVLLLFFWCRLLKEFVLMASYWAKISKVDSVSYIQAQNGVDQVNIYCVEYIPNMTVLHSFKFFMRQFMMFFNWINTQNC